MAKITAVVNDLMFMSKIRSVAEQLELEVWFLGNETDMPNILKDCKLVVIDLENDFLDPISIVRRIKEEQANASIRTLGYVSHVNGPIKGEALAAGCDEVISRAEFNLNMKEILQSYCN
jgi:PleD family two-component response regulator